MVPWTSKSNPEVSAGSALSADLTRPGAEIVAWLDSQHGIAHPPFKIRIVDYHDASQIKWTQHVERRRGPSSTRRVRGVILRAASDGGRARRR